MVRIDLSPGTVGCATWAGVSTFPSSVTSKIGVGSSGGRLTWDSGGDQNVLQRHSMIVHPVLESLERLEWSARDQELGPSDSDLWKH